jgi:hypothetical protein
VADKNSGLFRLKRAKTPTNDTYGVIVDASMIRCAVDVQPFFGDHASAEFTTTNSLEICQFFNLNKYSDKESFELLYSH